jgi:hypothetical protein
LPNKWEINDEVVNIYLTQGRNPSFEKLLSIRIAKFAMPAATHIKSLPKPVINLPEYQAFLRENELYGDRRQYASFIIRPLSAAMEFSDLTVRDLLNVITKFKRGAWIMQQRSDAPNTAFVRLQS